MKRILQLSSGAQFEARYNPWIGTVSVYHDGIKIPKAGKKAFYTEVNGEKYYISYEGNSFQGITLVIGGETFSFLPAAKWYSFVLATIPLILSLTLGNIVALGEAGFYYLGGALGGGISGLIGALGLFFSLGFRKWWQKLLIGLAAIAVGFLVCWGVANIIVASATKR